MATWPSYTLPVRFSWVSSLYTARCCRSSSRSQLLSKRAGRVDGQNSSVLRLNWHMISFRVPYITALSWRSNWHSDSELSPLHDFPLICWVGLLCYSSCALLQYYQQQVAWCIFASVVQLEFRWAIPMESRYWITFRHQGLRIPAHDWYYYVTGGKSIIEKMITLGLSPNSMCNDVY